MEHGKHECRYKRSMHDPRILGNTWSYNPSESCLFHRRYDESRYDEGTDHHALYLHYLEQLTLANHVYDYER